MICTVAPGSADWERLIEFAENCSWKAGASLARDMRAGAFSGWERVFAAKCGDEFAGYCTLAETDCIKGLPYKPYIGYVFVDERHRGMRLSQRMIDAAAEYARRLGFEYVYLISDHENFYEKYGFEVIDRKMAPWGAMEKIYRKTLQAGRRNSNGQGICG